MSRGSRYRSHRSGSRLASQPHHHPAWRPHHEISGGGPDHRHLRRHHVVLGLRQPLQAGGQDTRRDAASNSQGFAQSRPVPHPERQRPPQPHKGLVPTLQRSRNQEPSGFPAWFRFFDESESSRSPEAFLRDALAVPTMPPTSPSVEPEAD